MSQTAKSIKHISNIIDLLNKEGNYAVLRNFEGLPDKNNSRDIDIIITRDSYKKVKDLLVTLIDNSGWKIITYLHSDRLISYVCATTTEEQTDIIQWDFFFDTSVWGIQLMSAEEFLANKKFNGFLYYIDTDGQFLDKYLYNRAVGSKYPEKYRATREVAEHRPAVEKKVKEIFGCNSVAECDKKSGKSLILKALWHNLRKRPLALIWGIIYFLYTFIGNYICSRTGFSIGFTGPDGSGKTTVIEMLLQRIAPVFGTAHKYYHFRPMLFGNLGEVAHSAGIKKEVDRNFDKPHRGGKTGKLNSLLRLAYYSVDYIIGYFIKVKSVTRITRVVVFDRYFTDIICDSRRSRIYLSPAFLYTWKRLFIPSLNYNILLTANSNTILARKRELDEVGIKTINDKIDYLCSKKGCRKILNETTPQAAVHEILTYVFEEQHKKNLRRLR